MASPDLLPQNDPRSDLDLVRDLNGGDASAFDALYARYRDWVHRLAWRFTGNRDDALDVLQDTFMYLLGKFPGFRLSSRMTSFLYPAVKNISLSVLRKCGRQIQGEHVLDALPAPDEPGQDSDAADVAARVKRLPPGQREVLLMRFVDDMSLREIADALSLPLGTVKSRLHLALARMREETDAERRM